MEKHVEIKIRDAARAAGGRALKLTCPGFTGMPDRMVLLPGGEIYFAEAKFDKNAMSPRQKVVCAWLRRLGFIVMKVDEKNVNDFINLWQKTKTT